MRHSSSALLGYLKTISADVLTLDPFTDAMLGILRQHLHNARIILPFLKTLDLLLSNGVFDIYNSLEK